MSFFEWFRVHFYCRFLTPPHPFNLIQTPYRAEPIIFDFPSELNTEVPQALFLGSPFVHQ